MNNTKKYVREIWTLSFFTLALSFCYGQNQIKIDSLFYGANGRLKKSPENVTASDIEKSIADFTKVIKLKPRFWQAFRNRSRLYHQIKEYDKAIADLTVALKYADKSSLFYLHDMRAYSYYALGQYKKAIADWNIAVASDGNPGSSILQRAKAEWLIGQKDKACIDFKKAIELDRSLIERKEFIKCE